MGPAFLERGFYVTGNVLCGFIQSKKENLQSVLNSIGVNGVQTRLDAALEILMALDNKELTHVQVLNL